MSVVETKPEADPASGVRWRERVAGTVFPVGIGTGPPRWAYPAAFAASVAYLLLIPAGRSRLTHVWAEDGARFLLDALTRPVGSALIAPYDGYLHTVPRLCALVVAALPLPWASAGLAVSAALVRAAVALVVFAASAGMLRSLPVRLAVAAMVVLLPVGNAEPLDNIANLHWFLLYGAFWVLLARARSLLWNALAAGFVFLTVTSSALALLLVPLAAARLVLPWRRDQLITAGFGLGTAVQAVAMLGTHRPSHCTGPVDVPGAILSGLLRVPLAAYTGSEQVARLYPVTHYWPAVLALVGTLAIAARTLRGGPRSAAVLAAAGLLLSALLIAADLVVNWQPGLHVDAPLVVANAQRYSVAPCLFLLTAVAAGLDRLPAPRTRRRAVLGARFALLAVLTAAVIAQLPGSWGRLDGPTWDDSVTAAVSDCAQGGDSTRLHHQPVGWFFDLPCAAVPR
ncbi:hypothetical protein F0L68_01485 [Solihabitans fulvus]|uniref:DUF2029 domain-containing protein n=1 Tax=Solihabitans fulvus TaxID=1892852 RepID=A0A5B2XU84_9PSEU|nr:hypothetical protein [Solihabitans fulvus]KAA2266449.1 hypothetical protein F0L68_01485 [Solihabitans fulvus]